MKRICWISRHQPSPRQVAELEALHGGPVEICRDVSPFNGAIEIATRYHRSGAVDLVVVAPLSVLAMLCESGLRPLYAEAERTEDPALQEWRGPRGEGYRHARFRRLRAVRLEFEEKSYGP